MALNITANPGPAPPSAGQNPSGPTGNSTWGTTSSIPGMGSGAQFWRNYFAIGGAPGMKRLSDIINGVVQAPDGNDPWWKKILVTLPDVIARLPLPGQGGRPPVTTMPPSGAPPVGTPEPPGFDIDKFIQDWLPLIAVVGTSIFGANMAGNSAKEIADIQAGTAQKGLDLTKQIWETERADRAPFRNVSTNAAYTLSDALGLRREPITAENQMERDPLTFNRNGNAGGSGPALAPRPGQPNSMGSGASPNFDAIAARFRTPNPAGGPR